MKSKKKMKSKKNTTIKGKGVPKGEKPLPTAFRLSTKTYFLTYKGISDNSQKITKQSLASFLISDNPNDRKLYPEKYLICQQMYDSGEPHLHAILIYSKRKQITHPNHYDYLGIHPNIQAMRNMKAALQYIYKQDPHPYTNMDIIKQRQIARAKDTSSLYQLIEQQMLKDPFFFNVDDYCHKHDLFKHVYKANFTKAFTMLNKAQPAAARNWLLRNKSGIKLITPELIKQKLNQSELNLFYTDLCYQKIVDHINQIHKYPNRDQSTQAPLKTRHLFLVGQPDVGKTSLVYHRANQKDPYPGLAHYYSTYYLSVGQNFFPPYGPYTFNLVSWQQFTITSGMFPKPAYHRLLTYLDGSVSALPQKGRQPAHRQDNPKHILTSNRTLQQHILKTFRSQESQAMSRANLHARIDCIIIPKGHNIHFLRKLFVAP